MRDADRLVRPRYPSDSLVPGSAIYSAPLSWQPLPMRYTLGSLPPSSSGLGLRPFKAATGIRIPLGAQRGRGEVWSSRRPVKPEVAGSNPVAPARHDARTFVRASFHNGQVAQLAEHRSEKAGVGGSSPPLTTGTERSSVPCEKSSISRGNAAGFSMGTPKLGCLGESGGFSMGTSQDSVPADSVPRLELCRMPHPHSASGVTMWGRRRGEIADPTLLLPGHLL
jgi:hypothetical protein